MYATLETGLSELFPTESNFKELSAVRYPYAQLFGLDHYRGIPRKSFTESFVIVDKLVEFLITWRMQTKERTGRVSTQGPDQIIPYCTSKSFLMMHETLVKLENLLNELGASDLLSQVRQTAMVILMVENFFSLLRKDDPMPTQFEYGTRRATCVRELQKYMYKGHFHYNTGPKNYYPYKVINCRHPPVNDDLTSEMDHQMERLTLEDKRQLREFSSTFGASVRQHTVRDKSKEETGCLPYAVSLDLQRREPGSTVLHMHLFLW